MTLDFAADSETASPGADSTDRPKLLIVDDDPEVRIVVAEFLEALVSTLFRPVAAVKLWTCCHVIRTFG
jgi:hypothetical protein